MLAIILVGCGGFIGAVFRYLLSGWIHQLTGNSWFPYGTLAVNITGCIIIGLLAGLAESRGGFSPELRTFLLLGLLGGFTTFSTLSIETISLFQDGRFASAFINVGLHVSLGLTATWISYTLIQKI